MAIETDSTPLEEPKDTETCNAFALYKLLASEEQTIKMKANYEAGNYGYGHAKQELFELIRDYFSEARDKKKELLLNQDYLREVLAKGADKAREKATVTLDLVRDRVGLKY